MAVDVPEHRVADRRLAELRGERDMLLVREELFTEEDDAPFQQRGADRRDLRRGQRLREIDAADFRADMGGQRDHVDRLGGGFE